MMMRRTVVWLALALFVAVAGGCDSVTLSPRQQVVKDANKALCEARSLKGMLPYVTERSRAMLDLASSMAELGSMFQGQSLADRIAVECATASGPQFVDEVKVSETRYVVRTRASSKGEVTETIVVLEGGRWKIALTGK